MVIQCSVKIASFLYNSNCPQVLDLPQSLVKFTHLKMYLKILVIANNLHQINLLKEKNYMLWIEH